MLFAIAAAVGAGLFGLTSAQWNTTNGTSLGGQTYTNPILNGLGADRKILCPWMS